MTTRRLPHDRATGSLTGRFNDPDQLPPCTGADEYGKPHALLYDAVLDHQPGSRAHHAAVTACKAICATCPLVTLTRCLRDYHDEPGVIAGLLYRERVKLVPPTLRESCGRSYGADRHRKNGEIACGECRASRAKITAERKQRRLARAGVVA